MKRMLAVTCLAGCILCVIAFLSWHVTYGQASPPSSNYSVRLGLPFSPWLTFDRRDDFVGSFALNLQVHFLSWSTLTAVVAVVLWRLYRLGRRPGLLAVNHV